jgi:protein-S-isoprenylcysteine O-methyltransferase Ste14
MPVKRWDKIIMLSLTVLFVAQVVIFGLDAVRYEWSQIPFTLKAACFAGLIFSLILVFLPMKENPYLTKIVVVQKDQKVITTGPYKYVRHPMYSGVIILFFALPLALGSFYGLIPGVPMAVLFIMRTWFEDEMLHQELPGYKEYAGKTRYRLLPWVW